MPQLRNRAPTHRRGVSGRPIRTFVAWPRYALLGHLGDARSRPLTFCHEAVSGKRILAEKARVADDTGYGPLLLGGVTDGAHVFVRFRPSKLGPRLP